VNDSPEIIAAKAEAQRARRRLLDTIESFEAPITEFKQQLTPRRIMSEVWQGTKEKGADIAEDAVDAVRARPVAAGGVVAAIALFLAREPLLNLAGKVTKSFSTKRATKAPRKASSKTAKSKTQTETKE
jgi:hypothetical protein